MSIWRKIREGVNDLGWSNGLLYMAARALETTTWGRARIVKYHLVAQPVTDHTLAPPTKPVSSRVYRVVPGDSIVAQFPRPKDVVARRFADGAICFVAAKADSLVGFIWIKRDEYMEDEVRCLYILEPRGVAAWDFDVWVAPEFRLTRAFVQLWDAANTFLREQGYRWSISRISAFNPGSLSSHRRLGIEHLHTGLFLLFGPVQLALLSCMPYLHFGIRQQQYPVLRLRAPHVSGWRKIKAGTKPAGR